MSERQPHPTPVSPLRPPALGDERELVAALEAKERAKLLDPHDYDEAWAALSTDGQRLALIGARVRALLGDYAAAKEQTLAAHKTTHDKLDAVLERLNGLDLKRKKDRKQLAAVRKELIALNREIAKLITVVKSTAGRQVTTQHLAQEALEEAAESQERISQLNEVVAVVQGEVADVGAEVVQLGAEARPKLDSIRDVTEHLEVIEEQADNAAALAMQARQEGEKTAGELRQLKAWRVVAKGAGYSAVIIIYEVLKHLFFR